MALKKAFFTIATLTSMLLISCSADDENKNALPIPLNVSIPLHPSTDSQSRLTDTGLFRKNETGVALNPQHGQPGHRCDIAVGAPLNSPPNNAATPIATPPTSPAIVPATPANTASLKVNPKHGEPGHRCDIAEGAVLKQ